MQENKKAITLGLAAAGVLLGGYVLYRMMGSSKGLADKLKERGLTEVKKESNGQLETKYFIELFKFIDLEKRLRAVNLTKKCRDSRRKHYKSNNMTSYDAEIKQLIEDEKKIGEAVTLEVVNVLGIAIETFETSHKRIENDVNVPMVAQDRVKGSPKLSKEKTLEV